MKRLKEKGKYAFNFHFEDIFCLGPQSTTGIHSERTVLFHSSYHFNLTSNLEIKSLLKKKVGELDR